MKKIAYSLFKKSILLFTGKGLGKIKIIDRTYHYLLPRLKPEFINIYGFKLITDKDDSLGLSVFNNYEEKVIKLIRSNLKKGDIVCDIGAHIGYHTLVMSKAVGNRGKVYAFEPDTENFNTLNLNLILNNITNVISIQKAVSNKEGNTKLYKNPNNRSDNRILTYQDGFSSEVVETTSLDKYFDNAPKLDFVKMDIQGAEALAVDGMKNIIKKNNDLKMIMEFRPSGNKSSSLKFLNNLDVNNFNVYYIDEEKDELELLSAEKILQLALDKIEINIFCTRQRVNSLDD